jgi:membrane-bound lytic murein transglycosylase A
VSSHGFQRWAALPFIVLALALQACEPEPEKAADGGGIEIPVPDEAAPEQAGKPEAEEATRPAPRGPSRLVLVPVDYDQLAGWAEDSLADALPALRLSCQRLEARGDGEPVGPRGLAGTVADWREPCAAFGAIDASDHEGVRVVFQAWFDPFQALDEDRPEGTFTGYYEPDLKGALTPASPKAMPLYRRPPDLISVDLARFRADLAGTQIVGRVAAGTLEPYLTRTDIETGALAGQNLELLWIDDPIDAFFLHIQGSGRVLLPGGSVQRVGFAASNGLRFRGIGRILLDEGLIGPGEASMQGVRAWLRANPDQAREMMRRNDRFIFFRFIDAKGPIGTQGVPLTAERSLAVDPAFLPLGVPLFLDTTWPGSDRPLRRLMVAQDTGSAIKGPVRGDVFWGSGEAALEYAGRMHQKGIYYLFLPRAVAERRKASN